MHYIPFVKQRLNLDAVSLEKSSSVETYFEDGVPNEGLTQGISRDEVKVALLSRMKNFTIVSLVQQNLFSLL